MTTGCQYIGNSLHPCGAATLQGKSYCAEHYAVMYQKGTALGKRKKDTRRADAIRQLVSDFDVVIAELEAEGFDVYAPSGTEVEELG